MTARDLPEIRLVGRSRLMEEELKKSNSEQEKKSNVRQRQLDRDIYLTSKELYDIQAKTRSPSRKGHPQPEASGGLAKPVAPRRKVAPPGRVKGATSKPRGPKKPSAAAPPPKIKLNEAAGHTEPFDSDHAHSSDCDSDGEPSLVHLRTRTRRNVLLSQKLSRSLDMMNELRELSPRPPPSASRDRGPYRPVSSRSMEDLEKAASVLRFTEHEDEVNQLMNSVVRKDGKKGRSHLVPFGDAENV